MNYDSAFDALSEKLKALLLNSGAGHDCGVIGGECTVRAHSGSAGGGGRRDAGFHGGDGMDGGVRDADSDGRHPENRSAGKAF